jgi:uncharacterized protein YyaL (SSP411 family)
MPQGGHPDRVEALEQDDVPLTGPGGQVQSAPLPRATRKRLASLRSDVAQRLALVPSASPQPPGPQAQLADLGRDRALHVLLAQHRATGDPKILAAARQAAADLGPARGRADALAALAWQGRGLVALHDATSHDVHLDAAERIAAAVRRLEIPRGGFRSGPDARPDAFDLAANGTAARFLVELSWRIGMRGGHRDAAEKALRKLCTPLVLDAQPGACRDVLDAIDALLAEPLHATVVGPWENPAVARLHRACLRLPDDPLVVDWSPAGDDFPDVGAPCVYLARGTRCASPVTDEARLSVTVARLAT